MGGMGGGSELTYLWIPSYYQDFQDWIVRIVRIASIVGITRITFVCREPAW